MFSHFYCICPPGGPQEVSPHAPGPRPCPAWHSNGSASNTSNSVLFPNLANPNHLTQAIPSVQHFDRVPPLHSGADSLSSSSLPTPLSQPGFPPRSQLLPGPLCLVLGLHLCNPFLPLILLRAGFLAHCMSLLHAGERKVPEIMVHKLQEALAKQLDIFGSNAVLLESGTDSVSKFCLKLPKYAKTY